MFGTIRKHQRWLWALIIAAVIVSFVAFFSPNQRMGRGEGTSVVGTIDGRPLSDKEVRDQLRLANLSGYLRFGANYDSPRSGFSRKQALAQRLLIETRRKALGIEVSDDAAAQWIREYLKDPKTGAVNFDGFIQNSLRPAGFNDSDFLDFVRQEVALQMMERLVGVSGRLVTPAEAESEFRRANESFAVTLASFPASNFLAAVTVDPAAVGTFFTNRLAEYRIPERAVLSFVRFELTNHLQEAATLIAGRADVTNQMEQLYQQRGADAFRDDAGNPLTKEAAMEKLRESFQKQVANQVAYSNAVVFANELGQIEPVSAANLATLAAKKGIQIQKTTPFGPNSRPGGLEDIRDLGTGLSHISPDQPFTPPMEGSRGVVIAALTERIPSSIPALDSIRSRVESDFKEVQAASAARAAGLQFQTAAVGAVASGKTFAEVAAGKPIRVLDLSFTPSSGSIPELGNALNPAQVKAVASTNKVGAPSAFIPTADGGFVLLVRERKPVDDAMAKGALNSFVEEQRSEREADAFRVWFAEQMKESGINKLVEDLRL
ncbi:MAG: SurA N-terminal domain-containing protein [Verrucomicrobiales bacterium]|nr:SurA N-terminal domain-containing protein [Verrucomicrobiales bacterium]